MANAAIEPMNGSFGAAILAGKPRRNDAEMKKKSCKSSGVPRRNST